MSPSDYLRADKLVTKEVPNQHPPQHPYQHPKDIPEKRYLYIVNEMKAGKNPTQIALKSRIPRTTLQHTINKLKQAGIIRKIGYGTWEVLEAPKEIPFKTPLATSVGSNNTPQEIPMKLKQDTVRGHAFVFTLKVPMGFRNWTNEKREQYLERHDIPYKRLNIGGSGQRIMFQNRKAWLTNKSIVIYETGSYFAANAVTAKSTAIYKFFSLIRGIERLLDVEFANNSDYKFKVSRQHYALVKNALAQQYNEMGEKLEIRTENGLWFVIDNSFNLNEAETVHPETAMTDNKKLQDFFNSVKAQPNGVTIDDLLQLTANVQNNQILFSENALAHIEVIKELGVKVHEMGKVLSKLSEVLNK